jgi:hypothetical protein
MICSLSLRQTISLGGYHSYMPKEGNIDLSGLYPGLDPEQLDQAEENLRRYIGVIFRISERQDKGRTDVPPEAVAESVAVR